MVVLSAIFWLLMST